VLTIVMMIGGSFLVLMRWHRAAMLCGFTFPHRSFFLDHF